MASLNVRTRTSKARSRAIKIKRAPLYAGRIGRRVPDVVPPLLSLVAGYVDSCTFLALYGLFVAQATGSFVVAGAQLAGHEHDLVKILAIPVFVTGATITTFIGIQLRALGKAALAWCLALEAVLLTGLLAIGLAGVPSGNPDTGWNLAASFLALSAMGVQSALVRVLMRGVASTNVMTTNITLVGIDFAEFLLAWREKRRSPDPHAEQRYFGTRRRFIAMLVIVLGFLAGAVLGALVFNLYGWTVLILPIAIVTGLVGWAAAGKR